MLNIPSGYPESYNSWRRQRTPLLLQNVISSQPYYCAGVSIIHPFMIPSAIPCSASANLCSTLSCLINLLNSLKWMKTGHICLPWGLSIDLLWCPLLFCMLLQTICLDSPHCLLILFLLRLWLSPRTTLTQSMSSTEILTLDVLSSWSWFSPDSFMAISLALLDWLCSNVIFLKSFYQH